PARILTVDVGLNFTLGRISKAILGASARLTAERPEILIDPVWVAEKNMQPVHGLAEAWAGVPQSRIRIQPNDLTEPAADPTMLLSDGGVLACRLPASTRTPASAAELWAGPVMVPALPPPLSEQAADYCAAHEFRNVRFIDEHPGELPFLFDQHPETA